MAITFNQLLTVDWECEMSVHQQLNGDLFNQVYVAGDKLVRSGLLSTTRVVYGADYQGVSAYQFARVWGAAHTKD